MDSYLAFWGKTRLCDVGRIGWHPVAYHSLDVAAVASVLLGERDTPRIEVVFHPLLLALIALHDIGKFTRTFQCKVQELWPPALGTFRAISAAHGHDTAGYGLLTGPLADDVAAVLLPGWGNPGRALLRAACGHHGRPPRSIDWLSPEEACGVCIDAARSFAAEVVQVVGPHQFRSRARPWLCGWRGSWPASRCSRTGSGRTRPGSRRRMHRCRSPATGPITRPGGLS